MSPERLALHPTSPTYKFRWCRNCPTFSSFKILLETFPLHLHCICFFLRLQVHKHRHICSANSQKCKIPKNSLGIHVLINLEMGTGGITKGRAVVRRRKWKRLTKQITTTRPTSPPPFGLGSGIRSIIHSHYSPNWTHTAPPTAKHGPTQTQSEVRLVRSHAKFYLIYTSKIN